MVSPFVKWCEAECPGNIPAYTTSESISMAGWFEDCECLTNQINFSKWDVSNVKDMTSMFKGATAFNQDLNAWDVSNVEKMSSMFEGATAFNGLVWKWDVWNVAYINNMFKGCDKFDLHQTAFWSFQYRMTINFDIKCPWTWTTWTPDPTWTPEPEPKWRMLSELDRASKSGPHTLENRCILPTTDDNRDCIPDLKRVVFDMDQPTRIFGTIYPEDWRVVFTGGRRQVGWDDAVNTTFQTQPICRSPPVSTTLQSSGYIVPVTLPGMVIGLLVLYLL